MGVEMFNNLGFDSFISLQGTVHPDTYFQIVERREIDWQLWVNVLRGTVAGAIFRGALEPALCRQIVRNFWQSSVLKGKGDGLPAHAKAFIGAPLYTPPLEAYFEQVERIREDLEALFTDTGDFYNTLMENLRSYLADQGCSLRVAEYRGRQAAKYKIRSWANVGNVVLAPHDDFGVLKAPHLQDFEVSQLDRVVGVLICVENGQGGELHYWNISPNDETRDTLGFKSAAARYDSFGFPLEALKEFDKITVPIGPGDIYLFDVSKVHAVGGKTDDSVNRTTIAWSMAFRDPTTVLHWA
jgi:hypothetical protein